MQARLLKEIATDLVGKFGADVVELLIGKKDVNEFLIAKKLNLTPNQVRNILYKLFAYNMVSFIKKRKRKKGWYVNLWTLNSLKSMDFLEKSLIKKLGETERQLKNRETKRFYYCQTCNMEVSEETALSHDFACQECGQVYNLSENKKEIIDLRKKLEKLQKELEIVKIEKEVLVKKDDTRKLKRSNREDRKKKEERRKARESRKKEKIKLRKKEEREKMKRKQKFFSYKRSRRQQKIKKKARKTKR